MKIRSLLLFLILSYASNALANNIISKEFITAPFSSINVSNQINVKIIETRNTPSLCITGDSNSVHHVYAAVRDGILYLSMAPDYQADADSSIIAFVKSCPIHELTTGGSGSVTGDHLTRLSTVTANGSGSINITGKKLDLQSVNVGQAATVNIIGIDSHRLNVNNSSSGQVNLGGSMVLQNLNYSGNGPINIYWIDSTDVKVTGNGTGKIFLAGTAGLLDTTLSNSTTLDARYLRAKRGFINTRDNARADVWAHCNLNSLATGSSNIYYYNDAGSTNSYITPPADVLRLTHLNRDHLPVPKGKCCDQRNGLCQ